MIETNTPQLSAQEGSMTDRELMQMALDALEDVADDAEESHKTVSAIKALRARLANEFNPDWNQVEALQESLREHMAEIQRLRAALAQPEPEPVAWRGSNWSLSPDNYVYRDYDDPLLNIKGENVGEPLYTAPLQREVYCGCGDEIVAGDGARCGTCVAVKYKEREWVDLTDNEIENCFEMSMFGTCRAIEAKLREKNTKGE